MNDIRIGYLGTGAYVPETELTNADLERLVDTSDEWILRRTGVRTRHVLDGRESILDMAEKAARAALADAGLAPQDIDEIRVAISTWMRLPSLATNLQRVLGIGPVTAVDVGAGCAGFVYAIEDAYDRILAQRLRYGRRMRALVLGVDGLSDITDWTDRSTCVLLGDGAGAVVLGEVEAGGILATHTSADGQYGHLLYTEPASNGSARPGKGEPRVDVHGGRDYLRMDGRKVFTAAVDTMVSDVRTVLDKYRLASGRTLTAADIDFIYPHQANLRIIEKVARRLRVPVEKVYRTGIVDYGNTSAASIPLGYEQMRSRREGLGGSQIEVDVAFGAGFASGAILREAVCATEVSGSEPGSRRP